MENARPFFDVADGEIVCLGPKKTEDKRQVGRKYYKLESCELDINEFHNFYDTLKVDQSYREHYVSFYQEITGSTNTRKRSSSFKHNNS